MSRSENKRIKKREGSFLRFRPGFNEVIAAMAKKKGMTKAKFLETTVALHGKEANLGIVFKFRVL